jgi:hypothetical protein
MVKFNPGLRISLLGMTCSFDSGSKDHQKNSNLKMYQQSTDTLPIPPNLTEQIPFNIFLIPTICYVHSRLSNAIISGSNMNNFQFGKATKAIAEPDTYKADNNYGFSQNPGHQRF